MTILQIGTLQNASTLASVATAAKLKLTQVNDIESALKIATTNPVNIIFCAPEISLATLFPALKDNKLNIPVVSCGPAQPVQNAVKAVRMGAIEFLPFPIEDKLVKSLLEKFKPADNAFTPIAGDAKTQDLLAQAKQFAASNATILLRGESGTGKEVFSQYIHTQSPRKDGPFIAVNCAAIPESLLESELFGHEKGAFSGAVQKRIGKFQQAHGGTLLLDEISEMDLTLQAKLLRAIQEKVIDPVGSETPVPVDIRLIATTNRKLEEYVAAGNFREDLYFRLSVVMLDIYPLRERTGDILPLSEFFIEKYSKQNNTPILPLNAEAQEKLTSCYWKGNVRELENTLHRTVLMSLGASEIGPQHIQLSPMSLQMMTQAENNQQAAESAQRTVASAPIPPQFAYGSTGFTPMANPLGHSLADAEKHHILSTLTYCQGNREHAANVLGISLQLLKEKLQNYDNL